MRLRLQLYTFTAVRTVFNTMHRMVYPYLSIFASGLGVNPGLLSYALTVRSLVGMLGPLAASLTDRRGRKAGMLLGAALFTLGAALVVFWPTFPALVLSLCLTTLGKCIFDPCLQAHLGDRIPYDQRGRAIAITEISWSLAFILGIPLMGFLIARAGWLAPFPLLAILGVLILAVLLRMLPTEVRPSQAPSSGWASFLRVLTHPPALAGLCLGLFATAANEMVNLIFGVWLEDSFALKVAALGAASAVIGLSELGAEGLVAAFVDRIGKRRAVALGLAVNSLASLALPVLGRSQAGALAGLFFFYLSFEFTIVSAIPMMTELLPSARATLMSLNASALALGRALGAPLAALIYPFGFPGVVLGAVAFNLLAFLALRRLEGESREPGERSA